MRSWILILIFIVSCQNTEVTLRGYSIGDKSDLSGNAALTFPQTLINNSATQFYTISNQGSSVTLGALPIPSGPFSFGAFSTCTDGLELEKGESCQLEVIFNPSTVGASSASVEIPYSTKSNDYSLSLTLSGVSTFDNAVVINQAITQSDFTNSFPIEFEVVFGTVINPATFVVGDIINSGTAGGVNWIITNSGDDKTFTLTATSATSDGTIIPFISLGTVESPSGDLFSASTSTDNTVDFNDGPFEVTINQGAAQAGGASTFPIVFDIQFSAPTDPATFTLVDLGSGGTATGVTWSIINSGDNQNFTLSVSGASGDGSIIPSILLGGITDVYNNSNNASTSTDNMVIFDSISPVDNTTNLQFTVATSTVGNDIAVTWTSFTDTNLTNHRLITYTNSLCSFGATDHGLTGSNTNSDSTIIDGLSNGTYYARVTAYDVAGNSTQSACSTDSILIDTTAPVDNTANLQFTASADTDGNDIAVTWTAFTDTNLSNHRLITYTNAGCTLGATDHGLTGATTNSDSTIIDGLSNGTYYARVTAYDSAGNSTTSACSTDSILIDASAPVDNTANLQFTASADTDGNDIAVTWTAFTDTNLSNHRLITYTNGTCSAGATDHGLTSSTTNSNLTLIDGLADGTYYATVTAYDLAGNSTTSACSTDSILIDKTPPTDNTANLQFTLAGTNVNNDIAVTWTAFTDVNLSNHRLITYTNAGCTLGAVDHGLTGSTTNSNSAIIDGLSSGTYYARVTAYDSAGNSTTSACSTDLIVVDTVAPGSNPVLTFTDIIDTDGDNINITWSPAFTDNLSVSYLDHRIELFVNKTCTGVAAYSILTGSSAANASNGSIDGIAAGTYWGRVTAIDMGGNTKTSVCSTDFFTSQPVPMIFTVLPGNTSTGSSTSSQFRIPVVAGALYGFVVDWGDSTTSDVTSNSDPDLIHSYAGAGPYTVTLRGLYQALYFNGTGDRLKILDISQWGDNRWTDFSNTFYGAGNLTISASDYPDLSRVTSMTSAFRDCSSLNSPNLIGWNVSSVTDMSALFYGASAFNQNINAWNVSNVTSMSAMFQNATSFNQSLNSWNTGSVINMTVMFSGASAFNGNIGNWNVANVNNMSEMFRSASSFNQNLNSWSTGNVTTMYMMFYGASAFNGNISSWNVANVNSMAAMFFGCVAFNQNLNSWNVSNVTSMNGMFTSADVFNGNISSWNVSNVLDMEGMFYSASSFNQNISGWNVSKVTSMSGTFYNADAFNQPIGGWDVSDVTNMANMFGHTSLFNQDISAWDVSSVTNMSGMFSINNVFNQNISGWAVNPNVTVCTNIFSSTPLMNAAPANKPNFTFCTP